MYVCVCVCMCVYVCGRNTGHCARISPQLGLVSLSPLYLLIHAWSRLYLMPGHHIYIYLHIASLGLLVHRRGELTCVPSMDAGARQLSGL